MTHDGPDLTIEEFRARILLAGFPVPEERLTALHAAYGDLRAMAARLRRPHGYADEPAHLFVPGARP